MHYLKQVVALQKQGVPVGVYSVCSANRFVLKAAMGCARRENRPLLIEATANQVNQFGGYMGMTPIDFRRYVFEIADEEGFDHGHLILGGDHLGPLTWQHLDEETAMAHACDLVEAYVLAGFTKIHIDTSMPLVSDGGGLSLEKIAERAALLAEVCEGAAERMAVPPVYVVGSEVPTPGGINGKHDSVAVTSVDAFSEQRLAFQTAFMARGLEKAWSRVIAMVVQPGVEFSDASVIPYCREKASALSAAIKAEGQMVLEGHSTDYQRPEHLRQMVEDGVGILKVGPGLTFAFREALFALESIENAIIPEGIGERSRFSVVLEEAMCAHPEYWASHYKGNALERLIARRFSYSDRARYYLGYEVVQNSMDRLFKNINAMAKDIPMTLFSQFMPYAYDKIRSGALSINAEALVIDHIQRAIEPYLLGVGSFNTAVTNV